MLIEDDQTRHELTFQTTHAHFFPNNCRCLRPHTRRTHTRTHRDTEAKLWTLDDVIALLSRAQLNNFSIWDDLLVARGVRAGSIDTGVFVLQNHVSLLGCFP